MNDVRLSIDEVRKQYDGIKKLYEQGLRGATASVEQVLNLFDTIEALQAENEQLQAQVARMREALIFTKEKIYEQLSNYVNDPKKFKYSAISIECVQKIVRALADASDYHNPADVAEIEKLQNAFNILFESERQKQQENKQLQAQVAQLRVALTIANNYMPDIDQFCVYSKCKGCGADIGYSRYKYCLKCARAIIDEVLSDTQPITTIPDAIRY